MSLLINNLHLDSIQPLALAIAQAAISALWQSAILIAATWLMLRLALRLGASARFVVWATVFAISAGSPFLRLAGSGGGAPTAAPHLQFDTRWSYALATLWAVASVVRLAALAVQAARLWSLWRSASPVSATGLADRDLELLLASRRVQLCTSSDVDRPSVIGFFAPRILLPAWLYEEMTPLELRHVLLHEMEHLRRRDDWMNLLQRIALVLFPLNPALVWLDRRLAAEREMACDDGVLAATQMPRTYAASLASIAERRLERRVHGRVFALALGALGATGILKGRPEFSRRIEGILNRRKPGSPVLARSMALALVVAIAGAGVELARSPEIISFAPTTAATTATPVQTIGTGDGDVVVRQPSSGIDPVPGVRRQNVAFHQPVAAHRVKARAANRVSEIAGDRVERQRPKAPQPRQQWFVLTSAEQDTPAQVVIRTPDGRFFVAPYAAVPVALGTQDGWLILQL